MLKFTNSLHEKFGEVLEYGQADGVVDSLVRLVLQRYDPDGVTKQIEKQNESDSIPITCASASRSPYST